MDVSAANTKLPPTESPKFDRVLGIWMRSEDEDGYRKAAKEAGFSAEDTEQGEIVRYWQPLHHGSKEAFIYHEWDLFDAGRALIAHEVDIEDTGSEPD